VIQGDFDPAQARTMVQRYFGAIPPGPKVVLPDLSEKQQTKARFGSRIDPLARPSRKRAGAIGQRGRG